MTIERTNNEILLRLPGNTDTNVLQKIVNFLKYKEVIKKSKGSEKEVDALAEESKNNWWKENKHKFIK